MSSKKELRARAEDPTEHEIHLDLASGAKLTLLYFSDIEMRWIFSHRYIGEKDPGTAPEVVNDVKLVAEYERGLLLPQLILTMHVVVPSRLGREFFVGVDISPGAKTYLEFSYTRTSDTYRLVEICKGARERVRLDGDAKGLVKPIEFPFPILDRIPIEHATLRVPFRTNTGTVAHFTLPTRTLR